MSDLEFARAAPDAPFWGFMGAGFALVFANIGAAYGTGKSGMGISSLGVAKPELVMKSIVPVRKRACTLVWSTALSLAPAPRTRFLATWAGWLVVAHCPPPAPAGGVG